MRFWNSWCQNTASCLITIKRLSPDWPLSRCLIFCVANRASQEFGNMNASLNTRCSVKTGLQKSIRIWRIISVNPVYGQQDQFRSFVLFLPSIAAHAIRSGFGRKCGDRMQLNTSCLILFRIRKCVSSIKRTWRLSLPMWWRLPDKYFSFFAHLPQRFTNEEWRKWEVVVHL